MTLAIAIAVNAVAAIALLIGLAHVMSRATLLTPHQLVEAEIVAMHSEAAVEEQELLAA